MNYEGQICRAPMERASYMLPVSVGCAYNQCKFCMLFKHLKYRKLDLLTIEKEILRVKKMGGNPKRVFLGDGNAFGLDADRLIIISKMLKNNFEDIQGINMDSTISNIKEKSDEELAALREAGIDCLYIGIESGLDDVLEMMKKDHTLDEAYEQIERVKSFGFSYAAHIMTGVAGKGRGRENAEKTAAFLNSTKPVSVTNFSMFVHKNAPLYRDIEAGKFEPADELECLMESRRLIELLSVEGLEFDGFNDFIEFRVRGTLPQDREKMLAKIDKEIQDLKETEPVVAYIDDEPWDTYI